MHAMSTSSLHTYTPPTSLRTCTCTYATPRPHHIARASIPHPNHTHAIHSTVDHYCTTFGTTQLCTTPHRTTSCASGPASGTFRGSNNWLSFCGNVNESKLLSSAAAQAKQLLPSGCVTRFPQRSSLTLSHESHHPPSHALHRPCTCMRLHNCATSV